MKFDNGWICSVIALTHGHYLSTKQCLKHHTNILHKIHVLNFNEKLNLSKWKELFTGLLNVKWISIDIAWSKLLIKHPPPFVRLNKYPWAVSRCSLLFLFPCFMVMDSVAYASFMSCLWIPVLLSRLNVHCCCVCEQLCWWCCVQTPPPAHWFGCLIGGWFQNSKGKGDNRRKQESDRQLVSQLLMGNKGQTKLRERDYILMM